MKTVPASTPVIEPRVLKACEKFSLRAAVAGAPIWVMKGFDAVSRNESPDAITKSAIRKNQYLPTIAAGQKSPAPVVIAHAVHDGFWLPAGAEGNDL